MRLSRALRGLSPLVAGRGGLCVAPPVSWGAVRSMATDPRREAMWATTRSLADGVLDQDRTSLARSITLIESFREDHRFQSELLLDHVLARRRHQAAEKQGEAATSSSSASPSSSGTFRVGIAGPPGAGKSTFIEALGMHLVAGGQRVAVLAVDPSSSVTGGSILGDKTRMTELSRHPQAYVRPSPTRGALGGVAEHTNDVVLLCECAGYDVVLVESVGLGQSEVAIDSTVDMLFLVVPPAGGDELQGVKKGIMEVADLIVVNKADGDLEGPARHAAAEFRRAIQFLRRKHEAWEVPVKRCSALTKVGVAEVWQEALRFRAQFGGRGGLLEQRRGHQSSQWMWSQLEAQLIARARAHAGVQGRARALHDTLAAGLLTPRRAGHLLLEEFLLDRASSP